MTRRLHVGVDPGVHTGFAVWDADAQKLLDVRSMGIVAAMLQVQLMHGFGSLAMVTFEDARLRTWFGSKGKESLQGAGSIKRDCQIWAEWLEHVGCPYRNVSPKAKGAKLNAEQFARLTGWTERTNEHGRDAGMLILGMK